jgi:hypothetical protein
MGPLTSHRTSAIIMQTTAVIAGWQLSAPVRAAFGVRSDQALALAPENVDQRPAQARYYAAEELSLWEPALREQRRAEEELDGARRIRRPKLVIELMPVVQALKTRADLLLAEAVKVKYSFRQRMASDCASTGPGTL